MVFNPAGTQDHGGKLIIPCQDWSSSLDTLLSYFYTGYPSSNNPSNSCYTSFDNTACNANLTPNTWTPLAETLAEAGLYFARQKSWSDPTVDYGNQTLIPYAIQWRCQKNYIIIMTDGDSTHDYGSQTSSYTPPSNSILTGTYLNNKTIGDYDNSGQNERTQYKDSSGTHSIPQSDAPSGSDYLDDVAKFLYDNDLLSASSPGGGKDTGGTSYDNTDYPKQNIITYTIGITSDNGGDVISAFGQSLLARAADSTHGHGKSFLVSDDTHLEAAFDSIITEILATNSQYISPVVPVNRMNKTYADNGLYIGLFKPDGNYPGLWKGNLKKFGFDTSGDILDRSGNIATNSDGSIMDSAHSAWVDVGSGNPDGMQVDKGGAGAELLTQATRTIWTHKYGTGTGTGKIAFSTSTVNPSDLGLCTTSGDTTTTNINMRNDLVSFVTASGNYAPTSTVSPRAWILGDIVHSQPAILYDKTNNKNVIFVGANDGFLHCFVDSDKGTTSLIDDTIQELWAFTPWDLLPGLQYLPSFNSTQYITPDTDHDYYVDGSPTMYQTSANNKYLAFGLRRGGMDLTTKQASTRKEVADQYFILNMNDYTSPSLAAWIPTTILVSGSTTQKLGQSWSTPHYCKFRTGTTTDSSGNKIPVSQDVLLLAGGYDINQDSSNPGTNDTWGRALFAVNAEAGGLGQMTSSSVLFNYNYYNYPQMMYCMVDFTSYDNDSDGCEDTIYAPSAGGDIFAFRNTKQSGGTYAWSKMRLFNAASSDGTTATLRKFLYAPGIVQDYINGAVGDYVFIGSGDREHPSDTTVTNRFYAIKNTWPITWNDTTPLTDINLVDLSADNLQDSSVSQTVKDNILNQLQTSSGWYINLENSGEKVVSTPIIYNKVIYFTTYSPTSSSASGTDKCSAGTGTGTGRLYAINYLNGEAAFAFNSGSSSGGSSSGGSSSGGSSSGGSSSGGSSSGGSSSGGSSSGGSSSGGSSSSPTKVDRSLSLGAGIPSQPTLVITQGSDSNGGALIMVGTQQGTLAINTDDQQSLKRYFWMKN
jgi:type IV pilus assembly protein PilY1